MASMNQWKKSDWPFNPNFPKAFSFPAFGSVEWLAIAWWNASNNTDWDKIGGCELNWQYVWEEIYMQNSVPPHPTPDWIHQSANYSMKSPDGWVETLLDAENFWFVVINVWALEMVKREFQEMNRSSLSYPFALDGSQCEHLCRRFHSYQQARYRWHEHLLEKHCERALGDHAPGTPNGSMPETGREARACLIGWLSQQIGYAKHPLVAEFTRRVARLENKQENYFFEKERCAASSRPYRAGPDEMGWLILTWPVWNFCRWRWTKIGEALIGKYTLAHFYKNLRNVTCKEREDHNDWKSTAHNLPDDKAFEKLARRAIGDTLAKQILPRPRGRGTDEKLPLWDFAQQIAA
jgi:hypothetical protein